MSLLVRLRFSSESLRRVSALLRTSLLQLVRAAATALTSVRGVRERAVQTDASIQGENDGRQAAPSGHNQKVYMYSRGTCSMRSKIDISENKQIDT